MESVIYPMFGRDTFSDIDEVRRLRDVCDNAILCARSGDWFHKAKYLKAIDDIWTDYNNYMTYYGFIESMLKQNLEEDSLTYDHCHSVLDIGTTAIQYRMIKMGNGIITKVEVELERYQREVRRIVAATADLLKKMLDLDFDLEMSVSEIIEEIRDLIIYLEEIDEGLYLDEDEDDDD